MASFKVPCPSCEAPVLIKNPNLIGTKVECPKCKYRFKVEEPTPDASAKKGDDKDKGADDKKGDKPKTAATGSKNKKLIRIGVGVGAVALLVGVGITAFGGGSGSPKGTTKGGLGTKGGLVSPGAPEDSKDDQAKKDPEKGGGPVAPAAAYSTANTTHLLPGQTISAYRFNLNKIRETPVYSALVDAQVADTFRTSMGFPITDVETYFHCFAVTDRDKSGEVKPGAERYPFGVIKLTVPVNPADTVTKMGLPPKPKIIKDRYLYALRPNLFVASVSQALSMRSLFGEFYDHIPMAPPSDASAKPLGVCVYDTQHVLLGDYALLEQFLGELGPNGYPPFKSVMTSTSAPSAPGAAPVSPKGDQTFTSIDTYRTLESPLKKALNDMEADRTVSPMFVYAEKFDVHQYDPKQMKKRYRVLSEVLEPLAARARYVSANVVAFSDNRLIANLCVTLGSSEDARTIAKDQLSPALSTVADMLKLYLKTQVTYSDHTVAGNANTSGTGFPFGGGPGHTGLGAVGPPGAMGPGPMGPGGKPIPGGSGPGAPGRPPGMGGPPIPGGPGMIGPGRPGMGGPGERPEPQDPPAEQQSSHIDLGMIDEQLLIAIDLSWTEAVSRETVAPRLTGLGNQIKGKMAIFSSDFSWHAIAAAGPKAAAASGTFPRGTADRKGNLERFGLEYPPTQRVSLFYELLPHLGHGDLARRIDPKRAWYAFERERTDENSERPGRVVADNLSPAGEWVPELLVPYYPQSAWRATSPLAPDHVLGATNYVAVAGVGLDIARVNPKDPAFKAKVGITGYGWGSKPEEVTDGLSNTIYMLQTPPTGLQQPWIAGGGATVRGLDEADPMGAFKYAHPSRAKPGTYALMADGSVRFIPADIDPKVLHALSTRAGGETITDLDKLAPKVEPPKAATTVELKGTPKAPEEKKPAEPTPEEKKATDPKGTDPKAADPKKPADPAPPPAEKK